ncbi:MAG: UbiA family prenyltransferase, partial [Candidatus Deferrimicrobiaceae bacterium]
MGERTLPRGDVVIKATALTSKPAEGVERGKPAELTGSALLISKPGIVSGVGLAGLAGMVLAERGMPAAGIVVPCLASVIGAASGAAIMNGILDSPLDARMPRVSGRVEAMRRVGSGGALALSLGLILASLFLSYRYFHGITAALVLAAVLSYTLLYT